MFKPPLKYSCARFMSTVPNTIPCPLTATSRRPLLDQQTLLSNIAISQIPVFKRLFYASNAVCKDMRYSDYLKMTKKGMNIVDVRNPSEIKNKGEVKGAFEIPLDNLKREFTLSPTEWKEKYRRSKPSEDSPVMLICASGVRSKTAVQILKQLGYSQPLSYRGGFKMFKDKK